MPIAKLHVPPDYKLYGFSLTRISIIWSPQQALRDGLPPASNEEVPEGEAAEPPAEENPEADQEKVMTLRNEFHAIFCDSLGPRISITCKCFA
jgi:hypothetical protein